ncbi:cation transporter, partial [Escherichia coli]|uniref:cation transporter n=1 Tax=Escherichia coli TaxID=562 RepID=UPI003D9C53DD
SKAVVERVLLQRAGVAAVEANAVAQTATVTFDPSVTSVEEISAWVRDCGYHCRGESVPDHVCYPGGGNTDPGPGGGHHGRSADSHAGHARPGAGPQAAEQERPAAAHGMHHPEHGHAEPHAGDDAAPAGGHM